MVAQRAAKKCIQVWAMTGMTRPVVPKHLEHTVHTPIEIWPLTIVSSPYSICAFVDQTHESRSSLFDNYIVFTCWTMYLQRRILARKDDIQFTQFQLLQITSFCSPSSFKSMLWINSKSDKTHWLTRSIAGCVCLYSSIQCASLAICCSLTYFYYTGVRIN